LSAWDSEEDVRAKLKTPSVRLVRWLMFIGVAAAWGIVGIRRSQHQPRLKVVPLASIPAAQAFAPLPVIPAQSGELAPFVKEDGHLAVPLDYLDDHFSPGVDCFAFPSGKLETALLARLGASQAQMATLEAAVWSAVTEARKKRLENSEVETAPDGSKVLLCKGSWDAVEDALMRSIDEANLTDAQSRIFKKSISNSRHLQMIRADLRFKFSLDPVGNPQKPLTLNIDSVLNNKRIGSVGWPFDPKTWQNDLREMPRFTSSYADQGLVEVLSRIAPASPPDQSAR
jgi:hypothetical protein